MVRIVEHAPAKLNLDLYVERRRADGLHELDSVVAFARFGDTIAIAPAADYALHVDGPFGAELLAAGESLVRLAIERLARAVGAAPHVEVHLTKRIPLAAGLGGGSADAAAALRAMAKILDLAPDDDRLVSVARTLGSDVPACLFGRPSRMQGVGDRLAAAPTIPALELVLVNPLRAAPTGAVYARLDPATFRGCGERRTELVGTLPAWLVDGINALEAPAMTVEPAIGSVLASLRACGAPVVRLSGSGATAFAAFDDRAAADAAARSIAATRSDWWVQRTSLS